MDSAVVYSAVAYQCFMVCTKKPLLVLIVESSGIQRILWLSQQSSCLDNAFVSLHLRIPPRVLHFSALVTRAVTDRQTDRQTDTQQVL